MKLISFAIPSYNSQDYMHHCIDTLLTGGEDVEIIIVNDGSKDNTAKIADEYCAKYPTICKAIHKENGGHGSGVNAGLFNATGLYYKVVDSDDWVNEDALAKLIATIKEHIAQDNLPDLYITNYVYERLEDNSQRVRAYGNKMPEGFFTWKEVKPFYYSEVLLMHSLTYKTDKLKENYLELPKHTFYVDNIFAYHPLPRMQKLFYLNVDFYRYFIGRADQSVNINNFKKRYDQQIRVMKMMFDSYKYDEIKKMPKGLKKYLSYDLNALLLTTLVFICVENKPERKQALKEMWQYMKANDKKLYRKLRWRSFSTFPMLLPFGLRGKALTWGYHQVSKKVGLG